MSSLARLPLVGFLLATPAVAADPPRTDRFGDPLPAGAIVRLGTVQLRHARVGGAAFAADGTIRTLGSDRVVRCWDATTGKQRAALPIGDDANINHMTLSPDGRLAAYREVSSLHTICVWDVDGRRLRHRFDLPWTGPSCKVFSPDGRILAASSDSGPLVLFETDTGAARRISRAQEDINTLLLSPDGRRLVAYSLNRPSRVFDVATGSELSSFKPQPFAFNLTLSPDGRILLGVEGSGKKIVAWDTASGQPPLGFILPPPGSTYFGLRFTPDGRQLAFSTDQGVGFWDFKSGREVRRLPGRAAAALRFSSDGETLAATNAYRRGDTHTAVVQVWNLSTGLAIHGTTADRGHVQEVAALTYTPDGRYLVSAGNRRESLNFWDVERRQCAWTTSGLNRVLFDGLQVTPDGRRLLAADGNQVKLFELASGKEVGRVPPERDADRDKHPLFRMHLSNDGRTVTTLHQMVEASGTLLYTWDLVSGRRICRRIEERSGHVVGIFYGGFTADGRLYAGDAAGPYAVVDGRAGVPLLANGPVDMPFAFSPDGTLLAAGVYGPVERQGVQGREMKFLAVFEVATGALVLRLDTGQSARARFTADGRYLVTAGMDALRVWDVVSGQELVRHPAHVLDHGSFGPSFATALAIAPDGMTAATGHVDSTILLWDLRSQQPPPALVSPTPQEIDQLWAALSSNDAAKAHIASYRLARDPARTLECARKSLSPARAVSADRWDALRTDLDSDRFAVRERATAELIRLGAQADTALRGWLESQPSAEARQRIEQILTRIPITPPSGERLRDLRAVRILELIATPDALALLKSLAQGDPAAPLTDAARSAADRLERRRR